MLKYKDAKGRIFTVDRVLDFPIYSRKVMPGIAAGVNKTLFFDETGGQNENSNIDSPGQFSNTQTYALHQLQIDASRVDQDRFDAGTLQALATIISSSFMRLEKNKDTVWEAPLMKILRVPIAPTTVTTGSAVDSFRESLSGSYKFNEPIIFRPGEKFNFDFSSQNLISATTIELMMTMLGFLGISQEVMTSGQVAA